MKRYAINNRNIKPSVIWWKFVGENMLLFGIVLAFVFFQAILSVQSASLVNKLSQIEKKETALLKHKEELTEKLVKSTSLSEIRNSADELGYLKPRLVYIESEEYTAMLPQQ
jgi:predicted PurR-regulated permease PerM